MPSDSEKFEFNSYIKSKANERFEIAIFIEFLNFFPDIAPNKSVGIVLGD